MTRRIIVTGASGFIGAEVTRYLIDHGCDVTGLSRRRPANLDRAANWIEGDLLAEDPATLLEGQEADTLVHMAWITTPGLYAHGDVNAVWLKASVDLADAFLARGGRRIVGVGTCFEYDVDKRGPRTAYAAAKAACRQGLMQRAADAGASLAWARVFYLLGARDHPDRFASMLTRNLNSGQSARISSGLVERDFIDVRDCGEAIAALAVSEASGDFDIATGQAVTLRKLAEGMAAKAGRAELLVIDPTLDRPHDPPRLIGDPASLVAATGVRPRFTLEESINAVLSGWRQS